MVFTHLHVHSQYSFLDGASTLDRLLDKAFSLKMTAMALTDHNRLTGAIRFYQKARARGIKPIIGAEIDMDGNYHLTLLCKDRTGYSSLCRLLTEAHLARSPNNPMATRDMLMRHHRGLIALSGCERGEIPSLIKQGKIEQALQVACFYRELFGDDFFIELIRYPSRYGNSLSYRLIELARDNNLPVVASNNVHYADMGEYRVKELLNSIGHNTTVSRPSMPRTMEQYLKSTGEMSMLFSDIPEAITMTAEIAERCNLDLELGTLHFPRFNVPAGETSHSYLRKLAYAGVHRKYPSPSPEVIRRLEQELDTIEHLGFPGYFLVVWDIVRWARENGIRCQARGSAVDSLVVYALDISTVDPIYYNLLFERFMHPLRKEPPDIDLDIDRNRRDDIRDYVYQKYGYDNVACVSTINTYMARGAIRDIGKALQLPGEVIEEACKGIHYLSAAELLDKVGKLPELKHCTIYREADLKNLFELCAAIDGFPRHLSVHLGGLVIGNGKLSEMVPLERSSGGDIITQYDKDDIERLGLVKIDLLALPTITVIEQCISNIRENHDINISMETIPENDIEAFAMLKEGRTIGVFQLESPAQREMAGRLLPDCFDDIIVSISLVRPGPLKSSMDKSYLARRHGKEPVTYLHPSLENALSETLGVILYQEQVLKVAHDLAGMTYAEADGFRRAMTHDRTEEEMEKMRGSFIDCAVKNGVSQDVASEVFDQLAAFAAYGFCKAHAVAYAQLAYATLWLKCHYPAEFFAALLSNQPMGYYPPHVITADARRSGINILPLDINRSHGKYVVENGAIRVGLSQLKGITDEEVKSILQARESGLFTSLHDVVLRTNLSQPTLEKLIKLGACDLLGTRQQMLEELPLLLQCRGKSVNAASLFGEIGITRAIDADKHDNNLRRQMLLERELLALDLSAHPLDFYNLGRGFTRMKQLHSLPTGESVKIVGSVIRYQTPPTRNGKRVVYIIMEDGTGVADVTVFSDVQEKCGQYLFRTGWLVVEGKIQRRGPGSLSIIAMDLYPLDLIQDCLPQKHAR